MYVCMYVYIYIYIHIYVCVYIYIYETIILLLLLLLLIIIIIITISSRGCAPHFHVEATGIPGKAGSRRLRDEACPSAEPAAVRGGRVDRSRLCWSYRQLSYSTSILHTRILGGKTSRGVAPLQGSSPLTHGI